MTKNALLMMVCVLAGCSKPRTKSAYEVMKEGKWVISGCKVDPPIEGQDSNSFAQYPSCMKDDTLSFRDSGKLICHNGASECLPHEKKEVVSAWKEKDDKSFYIDSTLATIKSVSDKEMVLEITQKINDVNHAFIMTYSNKAK